jgi:hypothetical protein
MDMIYKNGDSYVKSIIENIFVRSFESFKKHGKNPTLETSLSEYACKLSGHLQ